MVRFGVRRAVIRESEDEVRGSMPPGSSDETAAVWRMWRDARFFWLASVRMRVPAEVRRRASSILLGRPGLSEASIQRKRPAIMRWTISEMLLSHEMTMRLPRVETSVMRWCSMAPAGGSKVRRRKGERMRSDSMVAWRIRDLRQSRYKQMSGSSGMGRGRRITGVSCNCCCRNTDS